MQRLHNRLKKVNIYNAASQENGYVGTKTVPSPLGFVYAEVFPDKETVSDERSGKRISSGATLILRREAGVKCGDYAGVFGSSPDSRVCEVTRYSGHTTVRTERL